MNADMTTKIIASLRDMAAKVDETVEREEVDFDSHMNFPRMGDMPKRKIQDPRHERAWLSGRLLGMADALEVLTHKEP